MNSFRPSERDRVVAPLPARPPGALARCLGRVVAQGSLSRERDAKIRVRPQARELTRPVAIRLGKQLAKQLAADLERTRHLDNHLRRIGPWRLTCEVNCFMADAASARLPSSSTAAMRPCTCCKSLPPENASGAQN